MSHDQKPAKMRLVGGAAPARRRDEVSPGEVAVGEVATVGAAGSVPAASGSAVADVAGKPPAKAAKLLLPALFLAGCAIGGAALPLLLA